jgi:two-component system CheB/CheR fusion protein
MLNLLSNAIKFTDAGEEIMVSIYDRENTILISVKDTGVGIPEDKLAGIFDRFNQVDKTLKRNQQGTGIGLSLVESLVKMHGGEICVSSEFGVGTEFTIKLPVQKVDYEDCNIEAYGLEERQDKYVEKINIEFSDIYSTTQIGSI